MGKPTQAELDRALETAVIMREQGKDDDFLAKSLLNHHWRLQKLERIVEAAKIYLHSGESATEHAKLIKAIEAYEKLEKQDAEVGGFGLE